MTDLRDAAAGRVFTICVIWTLALLTLGSIVHATGSSLACPDWPLCFGQVMPSMTGGVFWEHLHRLVAGGLIIVWCIATRFVRKRRRSGDPFWLERACWAGLALLLVQAVFGGLAVLYRLPDAISTTHLGLAFLFLGLATVLASRTGWWTGTKSETGASGRSARRPGGDVLRATPRAGAAFGVAALVFAQSLLGALVRHMDAGTACPDLPLCQGRVVPVFADALVTIHFAHRLLAIATLGAVVWLAIKSQRGVGRGLSSRSDAGWAWTAAGIALAQATLGALSVHTRLGVEIVSLHTLGAALLLMCLVRVWDGRRSLAANRVG